MNQQTQLKLQAFLDQELSGSEAREMAALLESDAEAQALAAELKQVIGVVRQNELPVTLPESREFYWSKIERSIRQSEVSAARASRPAQRSLRWIRLFVPAGALAVVLMLSLTLIRTANGPQSVSYQHEIETPLEETSAISFHSHSTGVTVVWLQSRPFYE